MAEVVARGLRFHVQRLGTGPRTVVFLHGLVMDNLSSWYFTLANPVAREAEVVLFDLRGHGLSERPPRGYRVEDFVADLAAVLGALGVARPVQLVGNSFGGLLALAFARAFPDRVRALVLVDAEPGAVGWGDRFAQTLELEGEERDARIAASFQSWLGRHRARKRTRLQEVAEALVLRTSLAADLRLSAPLSDADLAAVRCPVLAFYGELSDVRARGEELALRLPACELRIVADCTHSVLWEATERVRDEIVAWLRRNG